MDNSVFDDERLCELGADGMLLWFYILCRVSKAGDSKAVIYRKHSERSGLVKWNLLIELVGQMESLQLLQVLPGSVQSSHESVPYERYERNGTDEKNMSSGADTLPVLSESKSWLAGLEVELERVYKSFPRRGKDMKKSVGMARAKSQIKSPQKLKDLIVAVENYSRYVAYEKSKDPKWNFSKTWGHFMAKNYWCDWVKPDESFDISYNKWFDGLA